jgi:pyruvate kinase
MTFDMIRKTKIICTMGPAVEKLETIKELLAGGMNIARLNFAHGDHAYHREMIWKIRKASEETGIPAAILADVKGPEIRTGAVASDTPINLVKGKSIIVTPEPVPCTEDRISITYANLPREVTPGKHILIADGLIDLEVTGVKGDEIRCLIINGGEIGSHKNVNVIGVRTALPVITEKDVKDIMFSIENRVDFIAASFIRKPENVREIRGIIGVADAKIDIIAKIEDREGLDNIDEIIRVADGVMVARGDLGVQLRAEEIPLVQKRIIRKCNAANKPVITATQMLDSMIHNPIPTRAEVTDIANAIFDGTDAIMLSGETAIGLYPVEAVRMMHRIALETEKSDEYRKRIGERIADNGQKSVADAVAGAAYITARDIGASSILTPSLHGNSPKIMSRYRPAQCIIAVTPFEEVRRNLLLFWGVIPICSQITADSDTMAVNAIRAAETAGLIRPFDKVVILAGIPVDSPIMLNTVRVHLHCRVLAKSRRGYGKRVSGRIVKVNNAAEANERIRGDGDEILLAMYLDRGFIPSLKKVKGYILQEFSAMSYGEIALHSPAIVALAGTRDAFTILEDGIEVTIDGEEKLTYAGREKR